MRPPDCKLKVWRLWGLAAGHLNLALVQIAAGQFGLCASWAFPAAAPVRSLAPCALVGRKNRHVWPAGFSVGFLRAPFAIRSAGGGPKETKHSPRRCPNRRIGVGSPNQVWSDQRHGALQTRRFASTTRTGAASGQSSPCAPGPVAHGFLGLGLSSRQAGPSGWPQGGQTVLLLRGGAREGRDLHLRAPRDGKRLP